MPKKQKCISCIAMQMVKAELRYKCIDIAFLIDDAEPHNFLRLHYTDFMPEFFKRHQAQSGLTECSTQFRAGRKHFESCGNQTQLN